MRKIISILLALALVVAAVLFAKFLIANKQKPKSRNNKIVKTVFTETVSNQTVPIIITTNGNLTAKNKIELYSEVQGILEISAKDFKAGTYYKKGETILKINSEEFHANLQAQKSNLYNTLTGIMPDIRLDFPDEYLKWSSYLEQFDMFKTLQALPATVTEKEKYFISGRGVMTAYYNVKNMEVKLKKFTLQAPFTGVLTNALVNPGTLIRPGQKLGEFINPSLSEIAVSVKSAFKDLLQVGKEVSLVNLEKTKTWNGKVVRVNGKVDLSTQTIQAFIQVSASDLKEGEYLEVALEAKSVENAFEVSRALLVDDSKLYIVKDSVLELTTIIPVYETKNTIVVKGLKDGTQLLSRPVPGAHSGLLVKVISEK